MSLVNIQQNIYFLVFDQPNWILRKGGDPVIPNTNFDKKEGIFNEQSRTTNRGFSICYAIGGATPKGNFMLCIKQFPNFKRK